MPKRTLDEAEYNDDVRDFTNIDINLLKRNDMCVLYEFGKIIDVCFIGCTDKSMYVFYDGIFKN
jgi:hypothetical protein